MLGALITGICCGKHIFVKFLSALHKKCLAVCMLLQKSSTDFLILIFIKSMEVGEQKTTFNNQS